jgi:hypothetical protein
MEESGEFHVPAAVEVEDDWASESVWTLWSTEKSLATTGNRTPAVQPVALRYSQLSYPSLGLNWVYMVFWDHCTKKSGNSGPTLKKIRVEREPNKEGIVTH